MYCGSAQLIKIVGMCLWLKYRRGFKDLNHYMGHVERSSYDLGCELWKHYE